MSVRPLPIESELPMNSPLAKHDRPVADKCRLCGSFLEEAGHDDLRNQVCSSCLKQPEGRRILAFPRTNRGKGASARDFTEADQQLIAKLHGFMPAEQLLGALNERLRADLGPDAAPYTLSQLYAEIEKVGTPTPREGHDFASLRKLISTARRNGVLARVTEQTLDDFAVAFLLSPAQVLRLKDVLLGTEDAP